MENAPRPKVIGYKSASDFLKNYSKYKKEKNPHWTFGVWAKKLNLKNMATITRVVNGERGIGDDLKSKFVEYFEFNQKEKEYFDLLVKAQKISDNQKLKSVVDGYLGYLESSYFDQWKSPMGSHSLLESSHDFSLKIDSGELISIYGSAQIDFINNYLAQFGIEGVPASSHRCLVGLTFCNYAQTNLGPYTEFYINILARKVADMASFGLLFDFLYTNSIKAATVLKVVWGYKYREGEPVFKRDKNGFSCSLVNDDRSILNVNGLFGWKEHHEGKEKSIVKGFAPFNKSCDHHYNVEVEGEKYAGELRSENIDFSHSGESGISGFLSQAEFEPQSIYALLDLKSTVSPPTLM